MKMRTILRMWHDPGNKRDVGNIDFELQDKRDDQFLCLTLFFNLKNWIYLCKKMSNSCGIWIKWINMYFFKWQMIYIEKSELNIVDLSLFLIVSHIFYMGFQMESEDGVIWLCHCLFLLQIRMIIPSAYIIKNNRVRVKYIIQQ